MRTCRQSATRTRAIDSERTAARASTSRGRRRSGRLRGPRALRHLEGTADRRSGRTARLREAVLPEVSRRPGNRRVAATRSDRRDPGWNHSSAVPWWRSSSTRPLRDRCCSAGGRCGSRRWPWPRRRIPRPACRPPARHRSRRAAYVACRLTTSGRLHRCGSVSSTFRCSPVWTLPRTVGVASWAPTGWSSVLSRW